MTQNRGPATDIGAPLSEAELCPPDLLADQVAAFARDIERLHARTREFVEVACPACASADFAPATCSRAGGPNTTRRSSTRSSLSVI